MKETDLYEPIKKWLNTKGFDVYAEVKSHGFRSDVIGKSGPALANVELKLQLSFDLLDQALSRKKFFNYTYIAIPKRKSVPKFVRRFLERENIGLLQVDGDGRVIISWVAKFNRIAPPYKKDWNKFLREEMKENIGGDNGSHILTPYKLMMDSVKKYLERVRKADEKQKNNRDGWLLIEEILNNCETHYANPKPSLAKALLNYETDWCETKKESGRRYFRALT